jgi:hypothetical protein
MKIKDLSLTELKAAYDFVLTDLADLEKKAKEKGIDPEKIGAYPGVKKMENDLFHELLNITRMLK